MRKKPRFAPTMRFILSEHFWVLDALSPSEWHLIRILPEMASGKHFHQRSRDRLFPSPISDDVIADESTLSQIEDWDELIRPELEEAFSEARAVVGEDLNRVRNVPLDEVFDEGAYVDEMEDVGDERESDRAYRVEVPHEHTESWYSTLNQARLLMHEEYGIADAEERYLAKTMGMKGLDEERMLLIAQYELYSVLQSILVENIMNP